MRCIIIDDEPLAIEGVKLHLKEMPFLELLQTFTNALEAGEFLRKEKVDLMFLDIEMPRINGLEFLRSIENPPFVILTTAYPQFALEAFDLEVTDYLVKPIRFERFRKAVNRAKELAELRSQPFGDIQEVTRDQLFIRADRKYVRIRFEELLYIQAMKDYVILHTPKGRHITALNLQTIHSQLPQDTFARIAKSHLVNIHKLDAFDNDTVYIGEEELPIGRSYREHFQKEYVEKFLLK